MRRIRIALVGLAVAALALVSPTASSAHAGGHGHCPRVQPLERAHAHNDYDHERPLFDALDHGFTSVESDVWLVDGELYIGHDGPDLTRTLDEEYLAPLAKRFRQYHGSEYAHWRGSLRLLIDVKGDGPATWKEIERQLSHYRFLFTTYRHGRVHEGAVTAVISGNRDLEAMQQARTRYSFYDGRISDLGQGISPALMPLVSDNWENQIGYTEGAFTDEQRATLTSLVDQAHEQGYQIRFWATPDDPGPVRDTTWAEELAADVDVFNTDDLAALQAWLLANDPTE